MVSQPQQQRLFFLFLASLTLFLCVLVILFNDFCLIIAWPTTDSDYVFCTHENNGLPISIWDTSDLDNIHEVGALWLTDENEDISAHNVHIRGDRLFISFYSMGTIVFDISSPLKPVLLAQFDTFPQNWQNQGGLQGNWGMSFFLFLPLFSFFLFFLIFFLFFFFFVTKQEFTHLLHPVCPTMIITSIQMT